MAKSKSSPRNAESVTWQGFATLSPNGTAPGCRVPSSNDAYMIADQMRRDNQKREEKNARLYRCYKRFTPIEYSEVAAEQLVGLSNVPFGQMEFIVDSQKSSYYDMVTERNLASTIISKYGNEKERKENSEIISIGFDMMLRQDPTYYYNIEQDLEEMLIYGKGIEFFEDKNSLFSRSLHNSEVLIPARTRADMQNMGHMVIMRSYSPMEFWDKFKDSEDDPDLGWNFPACVEALRMATVGTTWRQGQVAYLREVASGNVVLSRYHDQTIDVYELYVKEFDGSVSKMAVLQNYFDLATEKKLSEPEYREKSGFIFCKENWSKLKWNEFINPFTDSVGSGLWHEIKSIAERVFVACRQYDINMNRVIDSLNISGMLMLQGGSPETTKKLKQMQWGQFQILPDDLKFAQNRLELPIQEIIGAMQFYMGDLYRGIAQYRINEPSNGGGQRTKGEAELDAMESAKLSGTAIRRYNEGHTRWQENKFRRLDELTAGCDGYEFKERFVEFMEENKVPRDAWRWENIESINSNMLSGAGSPSFKLMAATKLVELTGMTAANPGQYQAFRDAAAALGGRNNVDIYFPKKIEQMPDEVRVISSENSILSNPKANIENARVEPSDNHIEHFKGHYSDAMTVLAKTKQGMQQAEPKLEDVTDVIQTSSLKMGHMGAHLQFIQKDPLKAKKEGLEFQKAMGVLESQVQEMVGIAKEMQKAQPQQQPQTEDDIKVQTAAALSSIKVDEAQKLSEIKTGTKAVDSHQKIENTKAKAVTDIAIARAKAKPAPLKKKEPNAKPSSES